MSCAPFVTPKYQKGSTPDFVDLASKKGGAIKLAASNAAFNSFNPFLFLGVPATGAERLYATLMVSPIDDLTVAYPYVAESVEVEGARVVFQIRKDAVFDNGDRITAEDILFSFQSLQQYGPPHLKATYIFFEAKVLGPNRIEFERQKGIPSAEESFLLGKLPVFSKKAFATTAFETPSLNMPISSGPYRLESFVPNQRIVYERVKKWWGAALPQNRGKFNFDEIQIYYFANDEASFQAFQKGIYDWRVEQKALAWHRQYNFPAQIRGDVLLKNIPKPFRHGLNAIFFNTRKPALSDPKVRAALSLAFDFKWINQHLLQKAYLRNYSVFMDPLYGKQAQMGQDVKTIFEKYHPLLPPDFKNKVESFEAQSDKTVRQQVDRAAELLKEAGWTLQNGHRVHEKTGEGLTIKILLSRPGTVRLLKPYVDVLKRLGIQAEILLVDPATFRHKIHQFDYDLVLDYQDPIVLPGAEQQQYWGSAHRHAPGSYNLSGAADSLVDALLQDIENADSKASLITAARALDWAVHLNHYFIPMWYRDVMYVAHWDKFHIPKHPVGQALIDTWSMK